MYTIKSKVFKVVAIFLVLNIFLQVGFPIASYALTSGPSQPEVQSFEPVGTTEMVDLFTGDFTYNIPLFELPGPNGGYPFNLSYNAGISMDQEASWVGLGWNLNPGVINRQMRGFPDDFNGDVILRDQDIRPNVTFGVGAGGSVEIFGGDLLKGQLSLGIGIYYNNYKGVGYNVSPGLSMQTSSQGLDVGVGFHFSMDSQEGVGVNPSLSLISHGTDNDNTFSVGASYNSKRGLTGMSMGFTSQSQDKRNKAGIVTENGKAVKGSANIGGHSTLSVASQGYSPQVGIPMQGTNLSVTLKTGGSVYGVFGSAYVNGFFSTQYLASKHSSAPGYGYMYLQNAGSSSLLDFNREKDGMITKNSLNLAGTTMTHDIYTVAGQGISGMYRPFRSDVGTLFDQSINSETAGGAVGFEAGAGMPHIGGDQSINYCTNSSGKWTNDNSAASIYQFISSNPNGDPLFEPCYFKTYGEHTSDSSGTYGELHYIGNTSPVRIDLLKCGSFLDRTYSAQQTFSGAEGTGVAMSNINNTERREPRNLTVQPITVKDLTNSRAGTNNEVISHFDIDYYTSTTPVISGTSTFDYRSGTLSDLNRPNKLSHIAGLTAANPDGTRYIYGLPAYNNTQVECLFTVLPPSDSCAPTVNIDYSGSPSKINYNNSSYNNSDKYYSKTTVPAYAHSYLLTSILGADYIDADNIPGPSVGDLGYWVK
ncbi:MAG TPA: hypothetical protein VNW99_03915, partial [Cytophagaceae bacterium]|nr:hypothetical protein [Cytophagaceae bacterium]